MEIDSVQTANDKLIENISKSANVAIGKRLIKLSTWKNIKPWYDIRSKEISTIKKKAFNDAKATKTLDAWNRYKAIRNDCQREIHSI